jgi:two-component system phosphate regulon sensor histidine kinase PhoR
VVALLALLIGLALGSWIAHTRGRKQARARAIEQSRLLGWIDAAPVGWLILDPLDRVVVINTRAEQLLGTSAATLSAGQPLERLSPDLTLVGLIRDTRWRNRPQRLALPRGDQELELLALPGRDRWVSVVIQSRRSLEAQLDQQERWVSDVAHELRTPLTALLLVGDSLAAQVNSSNAVLVERLQRELLRLQDLVSDLLELSRLENALPAAPAPRPPVALLPLLEQVWTGLRPLAEARGVSLQLAEDPADDGAAVVRGDSSRLHRLFYNLLDNALRYSPDGEPVAVDLRYGGGWCRVTVRDRGPGLSEEDQERMFERFYRGDPSRARSRRGGTGLGLAIVRQIALTHSGRVEASNHPTGGALLEVLLPLAKGETN